MLRHAWSYTLKTTKDASKFKTDRTRRFEMMWARFLKSLTKAGVAAFALGALPAGGHARAMYQGKFALAVETHWGDVTLTAGDYTLDLASTSFPYTLYIQGRQSTLSSWQLRSTKQWPCTTRG
jgi:hypothetical protein